MFALLCKVVIILILISKVQSSEVNVTVSRAPKIINSIDRLNHPEDTNATFTCSIGSGDLEGLTFEWLKDERRISGLSVNPGKVSITTLPQNFQSILRIINLKPTDSATYTCIARNKFGQDKISIKLNVKVQLKWVTEPKDVEIAVGKPLHVPCEADGEPKPTIEWRRIDDEVQNLGSELRFMAVAQQDSGYYECRVKNGLEEDLVAKMKLNILVSDAPKIIDLIDKLNNPEGTNATLTCSIGSGDLESLNFEWYKDDKRISSSNPNKLRITTPTDNFQSQLRVINLKPIDTGVYTCIAKNKYGQDKISTKLNVKVKLKWIMEPIDVEISAGKPLHIPCSADGFPAPTVEWSKVGDGFGILGGELRFMATSQQDSGLYECRAKNGLEKDLVRRIKLDVLEYVFVQSRSSRVRFFPKQAELLFRTSSCYPKVQ